MAISWTEIKACVRCTRTSICMVIYTPLIQSHKHTSTMVNPHYWWVPCLWIHLLTKTYLQPELRPRGASEDMCRAERYHLMCTLAAEGESHSITPPSWFSAAHATHLCPSRGLFSAKFALLCFWLMISRFKTGPTHSAAVPGRPADPLHSGMRHSAPGQVQYQRIHDTHKISCLLHTDTRNTGAVPILWWMLWSEARRHLTL